MLHCHKRPVESSINNINLADNLPIIPVICLAKSTKKKINQVLEDFWGTEMLQHFIETDKMIDNE